MVETDSIYERGMAVRRAMFPDRPTPGTPPGAPEEIREDWGRLITDIFGMVWARPGLPLRTRSVVTVAALTALHMPVELRIHALAGMRNGLTRDELCEIVLHAAGYAGFPTGVEGMRVLRDAFEANPDLGKGSGGQAAAPAPAADTVQTLYERGMAFRERHFGQTGRPTTSAPPEIQDDWWEFLTGTAFGAIWPRPGLAVQDHSRVTCAVLQVLHMPVELKLHLGRALGLGITKNDLCEQILHLAVYGGFPKAVEAMRIAREVFSE